MNLQNIDFSFLSIKQKKRKLPNYLKWIILGLGGLIIIAVFLKLYLYRNVSKKVVENLTPTPTVTPIPEVAVKKDESEIEIIRQEWYKIKESLNSINYDDQLLQPPLIELDLQLDE